MDVELASKRDSVLAATPVAPVPVTDRDTPWSPAGDCRSSADGTGGGVTLVLDEPSNGRAVNERGHSQWASDEVSIDG